jgi:WD40 repeat protein
LRFHPNNNTLFSGSYDRKIKIWKISFPNDKNITEMLAFVETRNNALLSLCYSLKYDTIIASGTEGLFLWSDISNYSQNQMLGSIKTRRLVDGLDTIPEDDDSIVFRIYGSNVITILDLKQAIDEMKNQKSDNKIKIRPILLSKVTKAKLESFEGDYPYIYLSTQTNLLVSGGPKGQIWLYNTNKFNDYDLKRIGKPDRIIEWPAIENITKDNRNIIDDQKFVIINTVSISADLKYLIACTNSNLVCVWHQS